MGEKIRVTVDGRKVEADGGGMLLDLLLKLGIEVPRLCSHPSLTPNGACRLCIVEISKKEWGEGSKIVTSCLYPLEDGLIVFTRSGDVLKTRRVLLELYLARHPGSEVIRDLAGLEGIDETTFPPGDDKELCILCGLCARVCQDLGPGAISTLGRGVEKQVGPGPEGAAADCTGCRTCAAVCPTGAIPAGQKDQTLIIWGRRFDIPICTVHPEWCRGCGICEEVCPESIPRVTLQKNGITVSRILPTACTGCGICAGSCPAGAISQKQTTEPADFHQILGKSDLKGKKIAFICPRSPLPGDAGDLILRVSCIGRVDISSLLYCIAAGAEAVALVCRDSLSCPYRPGGELGRKRALAAAELLDLCGLVKERIVLLEPPGGQQGPSKAWQAFKERVDLYPALLAPVYEAPDGLNAGMDLALDIVRRLKEHPGLKAALPEAVESLFDTAGDGKTVLYLDRLPELSLLMPLCLDEPVVPDLLKQAALLLKRRGIAVRCVFSEKELRQSNIERILSFTPLEHLRFPRGITFSTLNELSGVRGENSEEPFSFRLNLRQRRELLDAHAREGGGLYCATVDRCLQYALLLRRGAWRLSPGEKPAVFFSSRPADVPADDQRPEHADNRVENHPILPQPDRPEFQFTFNGTAVTAREGEVLSSALFAAGITVFGHHHRDGGAQGIYCANGQCAQCIVISGGKPVKACMTPAIPGMNVQSAEGLPDLGDDTPLLAVPAEPGETAVDVLIIGGGPAGICAAVELGRAGVGVLLVDDKQELGGKLGLQTHNFFGSVKDCYAGTRGVEIGRFLANELSRAPGVSTWLNATVVGVFRDGLFGVSVSGSYRLVKPGRVLFATGAREKSLAIPGCDLPGVYGAGAFQTLVNRDLVRCAQRLFIIGGGNVGLIGAYHALQAGIDVAGLVEALPRCGGYKVHEDKIKRLGVPVWTSHTVLRIEGREKVERVVIAALDEKFKPMPGTERAFDVDTVLMAVGLSPVDELLVKAKDYGMAVYAAGDAEEIAEASAAIFSGRIAGRKIARDFGIDLPIPGNWEAFGQLLKHRPGEASAFKPGERDAPLYPLIRCTQEIPCNPCTEVCPNSCIAMPDSILSLPQFAGECIGCGRCVLACPGLAITVLVEDYDPDKKTALLMIPFEFDDETVPLGREVTTTGMEGDVVGKGRVLAFRERGLQDRRRLLLLEVPYEDRLNVAGFRIRQMEPGTPVRFEPAAEDPIVCRCERIHKSEIVREIRAGVRDMNQLKALVRAGLGACGGKTCNDLILQLYREEGIPLSEITMPTHRPLVSEVHLVDFISTESKEKE